jgi:hypothetical protein
VSRRLKRFEMVYNKKYAGPIANGGAFYNDRRKRDKYTVANGGTQLMGIEFNSKIATWDSKILLVYQTLTRVLNTRTILN